MEKSNCTEAAHMGGYIFACHLIRLKKGKSI
nr:MAG TPA: hypothetical protein [Caudoviricetes sp.]